MRVPLIARIGGLVLATTGFYTYVGQMVPQKDVQPPQEVVLRTDLTTADMVKVGREIMEGKGLCLTCHTVGKTGALRFPDLEGIAVRAASRIPGTSDVEYLAQSMYEPDSYVVEGFNPGMPVINRPPIGLTDQEILCVIAYLQSLGGTPTVTLQTTHRYLVSATPGAAPPPAAAPAQGDAPGATPAPAAPAKGVLLRPDTSSPDMAREANTGHTGVSRAVVAAGLPLAVSHGAARLAGAPAARVVRGGVEGGAVTR